MSIVPEDHEINPFDYHEPMEPVDENWAARRQLADASRRMIEAMITSTPEAAELLDAAEKINQIAEGFEQAPRKFGRNEYLENGLGRGTVSYELGPICGHSNPIAAPIKMHINHEEQKLEGEVFMGWQYEGPPAAVHGGHVAAIFDDFLGMGQRLTGQPGVTGTITIKYRNLTPLNCTLKLKGWVDRIEGRKNFLKGEIWAGDTLTAECEGLFIHVDTSTYRAHLPKDEQGKERTPKL